MAEPLHIKVRMQMRLIAFELDKPKRITFSKAGYSRSLREDHGVGAHMARTSPRQLRPTYLGLPYDVDERQVEEVKVWGEQNLPTEGLVRFSMDLSGDSSATMAELVAANLDASQLCDIIRAWLDADCQKWGEFERALNSVVIQHGRFE